MSVLFSFLRNSKEYLFIAPCRFGLPKSSKVNNCFFYMSVENVDKHLACTRFKKVNTYEQKRKEYRITNKT